MMKIRNPWRWSLFAAGAVLAVVPANAQHIRSSAKRAVSRTAYDVSREVSVQGTVVKFTENSGAPAIGAHVLIQTNAANTVDVFLGDARLLKQNDFAIAQGNSIRVIGERVPFGQGTIFVARLVQQGTQVVALRSTNGMPIVFTGNRGKTSARSNAQQGGPR